MDVAVLGELNLEVEEGETLDPLVCEGNANPPPAISWHLDGREVAQGPELVLSEPLSRYVVPVNSITCLGVKAIESTVGNFHIISRCFCGMLLSFVDRN